MLVLLLFVSCFSCNFAFLLDTNITSQSVSSINDRRYDILFNMLVDERNARLQLQQYVSQQEQRQQKKERQLNTIIWNLETRVEQMENNTINGHSGQSGTCKCALPQEFQILKNDSVYLHHELLASKNKTQQLESELSALKQLKAIGELQTIADLKHETASLKQDVNNLINQNQARGQDLVALYNKLTDNVNILDNAIARNRTELEIKIGNNQFELSNNMSVLESYSNTLEREIIILKSEGEARKQDTIGLLNEITESKRDLILFKNSTLHKIKLTNTRVADIQNETMINKHNYDMLNVSLSYSIEALKGRFENSTRPGFTAHGSGHGTKTPGTILKFPSIKSSYGLPGNEIFRPNGQFQVPSDGAYFITVSLTVEADTRDTNFLIYKNNAAVSGDYYAGRSGTNQHKSYTSGTGSIILQLSSGDLIDVRTQSNMFVFDYLSSLTRLKMV